MAILPHSVFPCNFLRVLYAGNGGRGVWRASFNPAARRRKPFAMGAMRRPDRIPLNSIENLDGCGMFFAGRKVSRYKFGETVASAR